MPSIKSPERVAIQGEQGSNSELAAREFFESDFEIVPCASFNKLFEVVKSGNAPFGMAPVENSLAGIIHEVWDLLVLYQPPLVGELTLRISHCLIGTPTSNMSKVRRVYSHPQALVQCEAFLSSLDNIECHEVYDTAGAVAMIKQSGKIDTAAIASSQAATDHNMKILASAIETQYENYTRFLVITCDPQPIPTTDMKSSVVVRLNDSGRHIGQVLNHLTDKGLTLHRVETRKRIGEPWTFDVYVDFSGFVDEEPIKQGLEDLAKIAVDVKVVGSYPTGVCTSPRAHPVDRH